MNDLHLAVVENSPEPMRQADESVVRLYDIGRSKMDEEEDDGEGNDDDMADESGEWTDVFGNWVSWNSGDLELLGFTLLLCYKK